MDKHSDVLHMCVWIPRVGKDKFISVRVHSAQERKTVVNEVPQDMTASTAQLEEKEEAAEK